MTAACARPVGCRGNRQVGRLQNIERVSLFYPPVLPTPERNLFSLMKNYEAQLHRLILFHVLVKVEELWRTLKKKTTPN